MTAIRLRCTKSCFRNHASPASWSLRWSVCSNPTIVVVAAFTPSFFHAALISSSMYGPASALRPWPRRHGAKNTHPCLAKRGPSWSKASWLNIPEALPWLYKTAGKGPLPSGLYRTPCRVRLPLGNVTTPVAGEAKANAVKKASSQPDLDMAGNFTPLNRDELQERAPRLPEGRAQTYSDNMVELPYLF